MKFKIGDKLKVSESNPPEYNKHSDRDNEQIVIILGTRTIDHMNLENTECYRLKLIDGIERTWSISFVEKHYDLFPNSVRFIEGL